MEQHFTLGAGPVQIMGQHVLPRLYGCRRLCRSVMLPINEYDDDDDDDDKVFCKFVIRFFRKSGPRPAVAQICWDRTSAY